jgi:small subunit ribosomal protein S20
MPHIPVHPSAQKRHRQNLKRRDHNRAIRTQVRTAVKTATEAIAATDAGAAQEKLRAAISALDKAGGKGKLHRNTVARKIARLSAQHHKQHVQKAHA